MSAPTVHEAIESWFEARAPRKDSPRTVESYRADLTSVLAVIARHLDRRPQDVTVDALTLPVMRAAFAQWSRPRAARTVRRAHSVWSGLFEHLVSEDHVPGSPMPGVARPKAPRSQPRSFSVDDAARIVRALDEQSVQRRDPWPELDRAVVLTAMISGARSAELRGADVGDVIRSPGAERLRVVGKGNVERNVPVEPVLLPILADYLDSRRRRFPETARQRGVDEGADAWAWWRPGDPLFVDRRGERIGRGALSYLVTLVYRAAGVDAARARGSLLHALRHTAGTRLAEGGATAVEIMEFLGHRSLQTSQTYLSATAGQVRQSAARNPVYGLLQGSAGPDPLEG